MKDEWKDVKLHIDQVKELYIALDFFRKKTGFDDAPLRDYLLKILRMHKDSCE